ncbi:hypothetical protein RFI_36518 [Reticulomyxa filosa]|uniref:Uncharacterized protein n=1 Tax=Reticulomyxa filosa TaxID=46433 RepID=X6LH70_RETFI|nr:hypothetical protein RFI_36518 [Reticulomyxa filosa]|eukprot:ETO00924.1 hypothetical protein RFI_36518 [Reticulomyxa filosa]
MSTNDNAKHVYCHDPIGAYFVFNSTQRKKKNAKKRWFPQTDYHSKFDKKKRLPLNISNILLFEICIGLNKKRQVDAINKSTISNKYMDSKILREKIQTLLCLFSYDYPYFVLFSLNCDKILNYLFMVCVLVIANFKEEFEQNNTQKKLVFQ